MHVCIYAYIQILYIACKMYIYISLLTKSKVFGTRSAGMNTHEIRAPLLYCKWSARPQGSTVAYLGHSCWDIKKVSHPPITKRSDVTACAPRLHCVTALTENHHRIPTRHTPPTPIQWKCPPWTFLRSPNPIVKLSHHTFPSRANISFVWLPLAADHLTTLNSTFCYSFVSQIYRSFSHQNPF